MRRGVSTLIFFLLITAAMGIWAWSLGNAPQLADAQNTGVLATRPIPAQEVGWGRLRVMTANIRLSESSDGENIWANRRETAVKVFLKYQPDLLACQEVSPAQGAYLNKELAQWYAYYPRAGVGPAASPETRPRGAGAELLGVLNQSLAALNTLYYRSDRFDILDGEAGLILPDQLQLPASENAYFTLAALHEKGMPEAENLLVVDVHLRHNEAFAVRCAARVREKAADWLKKYPGASLIVTGDMNHDRTSRIYSTLMAGTSRASGAGGGIIPADGGLTLQDAFNYSRKPAGVNWGNWHNFTGKPQGPWPTDLIFFGGRLKVLDGGGGAAQIIRDQGTGGRWPSDHFFVMAELEKPRVK